MRVISYSPSISAYACHVGKGESREYYDLSEDVVSAKVSRRQNSPSTVEIELANENHKYDGMFLPFDLLSVTVSRGGESIRMFTGYMTEVSVFSLYQTGFKIVAKDCIYRLQKLFFDPYLATMSDQRLSMANDVTNGYEGYVRRMRILLQEYAGIPQDMVTVGGMPDSVTRWALDLYAAQTSEARQSSDMLASIYDLLGSKVTVSGGTSSGSTASGSTEGYVGEIENRSLTDAQRAIVNAANTVPTPGPGWCAAWVCNVFDAAGVGCERLATAGDYFRQYCDSNDLSKLEVGMIAAEDTSSSAGHIGIYVGDGMIMSSESDYDANYGYVKARTVEDWISIFGYAGPVRWGWMGGNDIS